MTAKQKSFLKYFIAIILLVVILRKTNISEIGGYLQKISVINLGLAFMLVTLAQIVASLRMRYFFLKSGFGISRKFAILLFYVGSFYNFLLPGGIGGDAYKVIVAKNRMQMPARQGISIMIADRASGLCILVFMLLGALYVVDLSAHIPYCTVLLLAAAVVTLACYLGGSWILLRQSPGIMLMSLPYAMVTQGLWIMTIYTFWRSLGSGKDFMSYLALYCASSITSMLPVSVGGLGIKEMTYFYGAGLLNHYADTSVDGDLGVAISLCIFALSFSAALPGIFWLHKINHINYYAEKTRPPLEALL